MIKAKIFTNEKLAQEWNNQYAISQGCTGVTSLWFTCKMLEETTTMPKAEYAQWLNIPQTFNQYNEDIDDNEEVANPEYTALPANVTVNKYALVVGDELDETDEEGVVTVPDDVVDITDLLLTSEEL